ncbi:MmgE/PrpD family protein [Nocardioides sp.]|uniref:MmgE/PrpD family protein n=1 Tax=Nocardioides sp. TaxID=35761 RepID=UPI00260B3BFA|nr:MmgE/PrpD family protein [Nocardioides sp.]
MTHTEVSAEAALAALIAAPPTWSEATLEAGRRALADTLAGGIGGLWEPQTEIARAAVVPSSPGALAYLGGVACHALDWDDYMHPLHGHGSSVLLPAAWSLLAGTGSGADLLDAYLVGYQVTYAIGLVTSHQHYHHGWHATSTVGAVGAAAAAARALHLDAAQAGHALGIAASAAAGLRANFGTSTKALHAGQAARAGVEAALMAQAGATSSSTWLSGRFGLAAVLSAEVAGSEAASVVGTFLASGVHGLETAWGLAQKPYACCGTCHAGLDAVIALVTEHDLHPDQITAIELHVDPVVPTVMSEPFPGDGFQARYCLPWVVAAAAHDRTLGPAQLSTEALASDPIRALMAQVSIIGDLETTDADRYAGRAVIHTATDRFERTVRHAQGHPANPMSAAALRAKQTQALTYAGHGDRLEEMLDFLAALSTLETLPLHWTR